MSINKKLNIKRQMRTLKCKKCGNYKYFEGTRKIIDIETYGISSLDGRFNFKHYLDSINLNLLEQRIICLDCNHTWEVNDIDEYYVEVNKVPELIVINIRGDKK